MLTNAVSVHYQSHVNQCCIST